MWMDSERRECWLGRGEEKCRRDLINNSQVSYVCVIYGLAFMCCLDSQGPFSYQQSSFLFGLYRICDISHCLLSTLFCSAANLILRGVLTSAFMASDVTYVDPIGPISGSCFQGRTFRQPKFILHSVRGPFPYCQSPGHNYFHRLGTCYTPITSSFKVIA